MDRLCRQALHRRDTCRRKDDGPFHLFRKELRQLRGLGRLRPRPVRSSVALAPGAAWPTHLAAAAKVGGILQQASRSCPRLYGSFPGGRVGQRAMHSRLKAHNGSNCIIQSKMRTETMKPSIPDRRPFLFAGHGWGRAEAPLLGAPLLAWCGRPDQRCLYRPLVGDPKGLDRAQRD